jgi:small subunit ribosomal protein S9
MSEKEKATKKPTAKKPEATPVGVEAKHHDAAVVVKKAASKVDHFKKGVQYQSSGKRKNAAARVVLRPGKGNIVVNDVHKAQDYFDNRIVWITLINKPFKVANLEGQYDAFVKVNGGGKSGQAGAVAHSIAKAIVMMNPELKKQLKMEGLITRDSRVKEAKKYGRKKARKGYTYRKR